MPQFAAFLVDSFGEVSELVTSKGGRGGQVCH